MTTEKERKKAAERRIIQIAHDNGWSWWYDNEAKLIIDCSGVNKDENDGDEEEDNCS